MISPAQKISPPSWATADATQKVLAALRAQFQGQGPAALFVGGCVRNVLVGEAVDDIDLATPLVPADMIRAAHAAGIKVALTGVEHGTLTLIVDGVSFQITSLREDVETDGRHARVAFSSDWLADARRRDFTFNTLLMDDQGNIYDPLGQGLADLAAGQVRFVGDAKARIQEDYLRILRYFRFLGRYGKGQIDQVTLKACCENRAGLDHLSAERIAHEIRKILAHDSAPLIIDLIHENNILTNIIKVKNDLEFNRFCQCQNKINQLSVIARFLFLSELDFVVFKALSETLKLSRKDTMTGLMILNAHAEFSDLSETGMKRMIYHYGYDIAVQAILLKLALSPDDKALERAAHLSGWNVPVLPVSGEDLINLGMLEGEAIGEQLHVLEQRWVESDFQLSKQLLLEAVHKP